MLQKYFRNITKNFFLKKVLKKKIYVIKYYKKQQEGVKMKKKVFFVIFIALSLIAISNMVWAAFTDVLDDPSHYEPGQEVATTAEGVISKVLSMISTVGIVVSVVMLGTLGVKYMMGSVEERAEYKRSLIPYLIGAVMLFGITGIIKILSLFGEQIANL